MYVHIATSYITRCIVLWLSPSCIILVYHIQFIVLVSFFNNMLYVYYMYVWMVRMPFKRTRGELFSPKNTAF